MPTTRILGIETSCDETAAAVVENGRQVLSSVVASQAAVHAQYGGVYPEVASRIHIETIYSVVAAALAQAHTGLEAVDAIAVTRGPGLAGSLVVGLNMAKGLALATGLPILGINHLEAHLYSIWLVEDESEPEFPLLCLIVSGGHTELVLMRGHLQYDRLGGTVDDAAGEAFDKVARLLGLAYPGGPAIQSTSESGDPQALKFPRAWLEGSWDFSFSGLKTAVLREVRRRQPDLAAGIEAPRPGLPIADLAASFQAAVVDVLVGKTLAAAAAFEARQILVAGGVSANKALRAALQERSALPVRVPPISLCTDNAAMIAAVGHQRYVAGQRDALDIDALPTWPLAQDRSSVRDGGERSGLPPKLFTRRENVSKETSLPGA
ncbi:MAG TPA: tRNA (adenosine(37)-N6)-threonylcarbamoyltransferase complex transferase subunit TsaD [Anaerolineales bacterium]|nr:tRNA (adenosine(37)-N6)-threonylcarbamoyltransferase complex transferase subunit TsaD [Anaerolineales bacterium]